MTCDDLCAYLGTRDMLFQCALFAMKALGLALRLFLFVVEGQLIVALPLVSASLVLSVWIWFWKRRRKTLDVSKTNYNIRPHSAHLIIFWKIPLLDNGSKPGRDTANTYSNTQSLTAPCEPVVEKESAKAKYKYKIEFTLFYSQHMWFTQKVCPETTESSPPY